MKAILTAERFIFDFYISDDIVWKRLHAQYDDEDDWQKTVLTFSHSIFKNQIIPWSRLSSWDHA